MGAARMVRQWMALVKGLLHSLHGHTTNSLGCFSVAMCLAGHCHSGRLAAAAVSGAKPGQFSAPRTPGVGSASFSLASVVRHFLLSLGHDDCFSPTDLPYLDPS